MTARKGYRSIRVSDAAYERVELAQAALQRAIDASTYDHVPLKTKATKSDAIFMACREFVETREAEQEELRDKVERRGKMN